MKAVFVIIFSALLQLCVFGGSGVDFVGGGGIAMGAATCPFGFELDTGLRFFDCLNIGLFGGGAPIVTGWYWGGFIQLDIFAINLFAGIIRNGINCSFIPGIGLNIRLARNQDGASYLQLMTCYDITLQKYREGTFYDHVETGVLYRFNLRITLLSWTDILNPDLWNPPHDDWKKDYQNG